VAFRLFFADLLCYVTDGNYIVFKWALSGARW